VNKLVDAGAHILSPVAVGPQKNIGTIVDYALHIYSQVHECGFLSTQLGSCWLICCLLL